LTAVKPTGAQPARGMKTFDSGRFQRNGKYSILSMLMSLPTYELISYIDIRADLYHSLMV
jgi:hypothetical protein